MPVVEHSKAVDATLGIELACVCLRVGQIRRGDPSGTVGPWGSCDGALRAALADSERLEDRRATCVILWEARKAQLGDLVSKALEKGFAEAGDPKKTRQAKLVSAFVERGWVGSSTMGCPP